MRTTNFERLIFSLCVEIREKYFPGWDRTNSWKFYIGPAPEDECASGYCSIKSKTIYINHDVKRMPETGIKSLIIHEICHAIARSGHSIQWIQRMNTCAERAYELGEMKIALLIISDMYSYSSTLNIHKFRLRDLLNLALSRDRSSHVTHSSPS